MRVQLRRLKAIPEDLSTYLASIWRKSAPVDVDNRGGKPYLAATLAVVRAFAFDVEGHAIGSF